MSLTDRGQDIQVRLARLQERARRQQDARALDHRRDEWAKYWSAFKKTVDQLDWMGLRNLMLTEHRAQLTIARNLIIRAETTLASGGGNDELTEDDAWAKLVRSLEKTTGLLSESVRIGWRQLVQDTGDFPQPAATEASLPLSRPGNREALAEYKQAFAAYERLKRQEAPTSRDDIESLRQLAQRLKAAVDRFNFDEVPEQVQLFLTAINSGGGAPLALLTPEVYKWLETEELIDKFIVKSA